MTEFLKALFLGFIEGLTEFIPVSSTGHLIVLGDWLGLVTPGHVFEVFIQLGAILAVVVVYRRKIIDVCKGLPRERKDQAFALNIILATFPALIVGAFAHGVIKSLYVAPVIGFTLLVGGLVILLLEKKFAASKIHGIENIPFRTALLIGVFQMIAMVPGVSRSGATIMGALALGLDRKTAAEFSFFAAIPVMFAAVTFDVIKNYDALMAYEDLHLLFVGFAAAFVTALAVLKLAMGIISKYGFAPFAYYRIVAGALILFIAL